MVCIFWEKTAFLRDWQLLNAELDMEIVFLGNPMKRSAVHPEKAESKMEVRVFGNAIFWSIEHPLKTAAPIVANPAGSATSDRL